MCCVLKTKVMIHLVFDCSMGKHVLTVSVTDHLTHGVQVDDLIYTVLQSIVTAQ